MKENPTFMVHSGRKGWMKTRNRFVEYWLRAKIAHSNNIPYTITSTQIESSWYKHCGIALPTAYHEI